MCGSSLLYVLPCESGVCGNEVADESHMSLNHSIMVYLVYMYNVYVYVYYKARWCRLFIFPAYSANKFKQCCLSIAGLSNSFYVVSGTQTLPPPPPGGSNDDSGLPHAAHISQKVVCGPGT